MTFKITNYTTNEKIITTSYCEFRHIMIMCCLDFIRRGDYYTIDFDTICHEDDGRRICPNECTSKYLLRLARCLVIDCINCHDWGDIAEVEIID